MILALLKTFVGVVFVSLGFMTLSFSVGIFFISEDCFFVDPFDLEFFFNSLTPYPKILTVFFWGIIFSLGIKIFFMGIYDLGEKLDQSISLKG